MHRSPQRHRLSHFEPTLEPERHIQGVTATLLLFGLLVTILLVGGTAPGL